MDPDDLQPWTAARCQRILRQLQSRLASLRRIVSEDRPTVSKRSITTIEPSSKRVRLTYSQKTSQPVPTLSTSPKTPPRQIRTLGAMRLGMSSPAAGPVDFRTPMWRKIQEDASTPQRCWDSNAALFKVEVCTAIPQHLTEGLQSLQHQTTSRQSRLYESIFEWFNGLLRLTAPRVRQLHHKSLLGMCLRVVPACINSIEEWDRQLSKQDGTESMWDSSDTSFDIYNQLEAFGPENSGWQPLKLVVRSQAINLLSRASVDGLFQPDYVNILIGLCIHFNAYEEAAKLLSATSGELPPPRSLKSSFKENRKLQPLVSLSESFGQERTPGHVFDSISTLVGERRLPSAWLCTVSFSRLWTSSLEILTSQKPKPSAVRFMHTIIKTFMSSEASSSSTDRWITEQAFTGVVAGLTTAAIALDANSGSDKTSRNNRAWRRLLHVLESSIALIQRLICKTEAKDRKLLVLAVARFLVAGNSELACAMYKRQAACELEELATKSNPTDENLRYRHIVLLICTIIQCHRRSNSSSSHDMTWSIFSKLDTLTLPPWFGPGLKNDVAFMLAQKTKNLRDLAFAESILAATTSSVADSTLFSGWRWEEGISEWVLPTPNSSTRNKTDKTAPKKKVGRRLGAASHRTSLKAHSVQMRCESPCLSNVHRVVRQVPTATERPTHSTGELDHRHTIIQGPKRLFTNAAIRSQGTTVSRKERAAFALLSQRYKSNDGLDELL